MQKTIVQVRDLELIEKELKTCPMGILALYADDEKVVQAATTFLYQDKNIFLFLDDSSDLYQSIHFNAYASFAIIKNDKPRRSAKSNNHPSYQSFSVIISGSIKKVDEQKVIDELKQNYLKKYSVENEKEASLDLTNDYAIIIDTEEIQAFEETGG